MKPSDGPHMALHCGKMAHDSRSAHMAHAVTEVGHVNPCRMRLILVSAYSQDSTQSDRPSFLQAGVDHTATPHHRPPGVDGIRCEWLEKACLARFPGQRSSVIRTLLFPRPRKRCARLHAIPTSYWLSAGKQTAMLSDRSRALWRESLVVQDEEMYLKANAHKARKVMRCKTCQLL